MDVLARVCNKDSGTFVELWCDEYYTENPLRDWGDDNFHIELKGQWEQLGTEHCPHVLDGKEFRSDRDFFREVAKRGGVAVPIRAYEHSSVSFSLANTGYPFNDPWDSYWAGWAYMTPEEVRKTYCGTGAQQFKTAFKFLEAQVRLMNAYANGQIYGVSCYGPDGECVESCGGFFDTFDTTDGLMEDIAYSVPTEYKEMVKQLDFGHFDELEVIVTRRVKN